ncbi:sulfite exporter TauE/SafE family protein [Vibrio sp. SS-MA-C1-2]|uniref:sulfite exporter TauE/SafE family protein n=1 Tax=Vibrio sp. SS-MA-C1-2 TaxID=2908646 RepID=UPI001F24CF1E|nr:sulfite exporter TauE/SafE family protein [Vibrio sp. SS-MA-C1-2]UJF17428.1 sulfite exporter TauE/SafE family protein [Vibrio sp. SS-MA-C1-2]
MDFITFFNQLIATDQLLFKIVLGSFFGLCLGLTGVGGGVLLIPMLQIFCGMETILAVGTASMISSLVKINASIVHIRAKNVSWRAIGYLFIGAVPMTLIITQVVIYFSNHPIHQATTQMIVQVLVMTVMAGSLISVVLKFRHLNQEKSAPNPAKNNNKTAIFSGAFCGTILGSTGVGGGVLLLPILNSVLNLNIKKAIGSSVVLALILTALTAIAYAKGGQSDLHTALLFVIGSFAGVQVAAKLIHSLSEKRIYLITIAVLSLSLLLSLY